MGVGPFHRTEIYGIAYGLNALFGELTYNRHQAKLERKLNGPLKIITISDYLHSKTDYSTSTKIILNSWFRLNG